MHNVPKNIDTKLPTYNTSPIGCLRADHDCYLEQTAEPRAQYNELKPKVKVKTT